MLLCQYLELSPDFSAALSCVMPAAILKATTFLPKRERTRQATCIF